MADVFLSLSAGDRRDALAVASAASGRPTHLLEKDVWVVWALETLFGAKFGPHLVFKGGTSLSKAYGAIRRFSEDVDLTYDIRTIAPDLVGDDDEALPSTRSQERKWSKDIKERLSGWVQDQALVSINAALSANQLRAAAHAEGANIFIAYDRLTAGTGYVRPQVMLEFGARSTGEPWDALPIRCDAEPFLTNLSFPSARAQVMRIERTFWEKATAIHVFCAQGRFRGADRFARHWHDIARLADNDFATSAIADTEVAQAVARHKAIFFAEKDAHGEVIDYNGAVSGGLQLIPDGAALTRLADDYRRMVDDGLLLDDAETLDDLIAKCRQVEQLANAK
jgi:Nucleotidyl transferase AbiEii toxin, Type IV TA system